MSKDSLVPEDFARLLTACDLEPIHVPGLIQPHGVLLVLNDPDLRVLQCSANVGEIFGWDIDSVLNKGADALLPAYAYEKLVQAMLSHEMSAGFSLDAVMETPKGPFHFDIIAHRANGCFIVEFEPAMDESLSMRELYSGIRHAASKIQYARAVDELCANAVEEIRSLTGYDRVMVYRFDDDWHGQVIAESLAPFVDSYLGLEFPDTDIPRQARELYRKNWLRLIPDVSYIPVPVVPAINPKSHTPIDLSFSSLRSVSPVHIQYLKNMGVSASMSISLIRNGELWGLIVCHHSQPRFLPYSVRLACEFYGRTSSLQLAARTESEQYQYRMALSKAQADIVEAMSLESDLAVALMACDANLLTLTAADGAAISIGGKLQLVGKTPSIQEVEDIVAWLQEHADDDVFVSDALSSHNERFGRFGVVASGVVAAPISPAKGDYLLWFRQEYVHTITWAGDPDKKHSAHAERLHPRKSFEHFKEIVRGRSRRWQSAEIEAAVELRRLVIAFLNQRTQELERLNWELSRRNDELHVLAHITSHDLKEPLRGIHNYASYLLEDYYEILDSPGRQKLDTLVRLTKRMHALIDSLAQLSRISRINVGAEKTNLEEIVSGLAQLFKPRLEEAGITLTMKGPFPPVLGDQFWIQQVLSNLLSNGIKYASSFRPWVEIGVIRPPLIEGTVTAATGEDADRVTTVYVRDNGIGIPQNQLKKIFNMFVRLHAPDAYGGGTGAGLALAAKITERLHGALWAASETGAGSTFYLNLPSA